MESGRHLEGPVPGRRFRLLLTHEIYVTGSKDYQLWYDTTRKAWDAGILKSAVDSVNGLVWTSRFGPRSLTRVAPPRSRTPTMSRFRGSPTSPATTRSTSRTTGASTPTDGNPLRPPRVRLSRGEPLYARRIRKFSDEFPFDGVFLSVRSHSPPPDHADQFGFNEPIVREFQQRYGKNILRQAFDLEAWRSPRGEYLTTLLREVRAHLRSQTEALDRSAQGDTRSADRQHAHRWRAGSPRTRRRAGRGHHTLERATYPHRWQRGYGYVQSQDERVGSRRSSSRCVKPTARSAQHNVKLYVDCRWATFTACTMTSFFGPGASPPTVPSTRQVARGNS